MLHADVPSMLIRIRAGRKLVVVVLRSPIHANEPSEYNGMLYRTSNRVLNNGIKVIILICMDGTSQYHHHQKILVVVVLRSPIHANEPSEYNGMLYRTSNRVLNNGIKVIILICMDGTSQYHHYQNFIGFWTKSSREVGLPYMEPRRRLDRHIWLVMNYSCL